MDGDQGGRPADLETLFERFESLPSHDAESTKRELADAILGAIAARLARADQLDARFRRVRAATTRARLLGPAATGFDAAVLALIDAAREAFAGEDVAGVAPVRRPPSPAGAPGDVVNEASEDSFPASDPPGYVGGEGGSR